MKFTLAKQVLLDGLNKVAGVVSTRPSMPILSNVLLAAAEGGLKLTTTNMELTIESKIPCMVEKPGAITLPAKKLQSIIREMRDGEVSVEVAGTVATIRCDRAQFKLNGLAPEEFPGLPAAKEAREFKVPQAMLSGSPEASKPRQASVRFANRASCCGVPTFSSTEKAFAYFSRYSFE